MSWQAGDESEIDSRLVSHPGWQMAGQPWPFSKATIIWVREQLVAAGTGGKPLARTHHRRLDAPVPRSAGLAYRRSMISFSVPRRRRCTSGSV